MTTNEHVDIALPLAHSPARPRWTRTRLWKWFSDPILVALGLGVLPFAAFMAIGSYEGSLVLAGPGEDPSWSVAGGGARGLLEDAIFLTYFLFVPMVAGAVPYALRTTERAFANGRLFLKIDGSDGRGITTEEIAALREYTTGVLRGTNAPLGEKHAGILANDLGIRDRRRMHQLLEWALLLGTLAFVAGSTFNHANAIDVYGFPIWADLGHGRWLGFTARLFYESVGYLIVGIVGVSSVVRILSAVTTTLNALAQRNAIRYVPYPYDDAGHLLEFGIACLQATATVTPLLIPALVYVWTYPVTPLLVVGVGLLTAGLPLLAILPLFRIHRAMRRLVDAELLSVSRDMEKLYRRVRVALSARANGVGEDDELQQLLEILEKIEILYSYLQNSNPWPYRRRTVAVVIGLSTVVASSLWASLVGGG